MASKGTRAPRTPSSGRRARDGGTSRLNPPLAPAKAVDEPAPAILAQPVAAPTVATEAVSLAAVVPATLGADVVATSRAVAEPAPAPSVSKPRSAEPAEAAPVTDAPSAPAEEADAVIADTMDAVASPAGDAVTTTQTETAAPDAPAADQAEDVIMDTVDTTNKAQAMFADMNTRAKTAVEKSTRMVEEMGEFQKGNLEAMVESGRIYAKGVEAMGQDAADYGRRSFESMTAVFKNMAQVKTASELMKLQADYVRQSFDAAVAEGSKNTEAAIKLANDVAQPMSNRFAVAAGKMKAPVAA